MSSLRFDRLFRRLKSTKPAALTRGLSCVSYCWPDGSLVKQAADRLALSGPPLEGAIEARNHCKLEKILILLNEPFFLLLSF